MSELQDKVSELAVEFEVPGVSVGVINDGEESYGYAGVTSAENPLPVDEKTLFQFGSTGKTYTATAMMRLVEQGKVELDAPVRTYVPELRLRDEDVAAKVNILQLFNHTAGWEGDLIEEMGNGDDSLAKYVTRMADLQQVSPLGAIVSYNNASLSLAGRVIEKVTGTTYEQAIIDLLLEPLGMKDTLFFPGDIMLRRFAAGHKRIDGETTIAHPWPMPRSATPAGGMSATARDQIAWARFHLGDGTAPDGTRLLSAEAVKQMQQPTADMTGNALGDAVGISWLLSDYAGEAKVAHGGTTYGQYSDFVLIPGRNFGVISMANCGPNGSQFNHKIVAWALEHFLGLVNPDPETIRLPDAELAPYTGGFETIAATLEITAKDGRLVVQVAPKKSMAAAHADEDEQQPPPPYVIALLAGNQDQFVIDEGDAKGMKGFFTRGDVGNIDAVNFGGRLATRTDAASAAS